MELRSTRSRSRTPSEPHEIVQNKVNHQLEMSTSVVLKRFTIDAILETDEKSSRTTVKKGRKKKVVTSDYSSEDGESSGQQMHTNGGTKFNHNEMLALKKFREAPEYWNRVPKTDYTYSPHSKDRVELAPGVVNMPNMSRKSIRQMGYENKQTNTDLYVATATATATETNQYSVKRALFANNNYVYRRTYFERVVSIFTKVFIVCELVLKTLARPVYSVHSWGLYLLSLLYKLGSFIMLTDTWVLRSHTAISDHQKNKLLSLLGLCLLPFIFFGGIWLLSSIGQMMSQMVYAPAMTSPKLGDIRIHVDAPLVLTPYQIRQIAQSVKENLDVDVDLETIVMVLQDDPNLQFKSSKSSEQPPQQQINEEQLMAAITSKLKQSQEQDESLLLAKVLSSPTITKIINQQSSSDNSAAIIAALKEEIQSLKQDFQSSTVSNMAHYQRLLAESRRCCRNNLVYLESLIAKMAQKHLKECQTDEYIGGSNNFDFQQSIKKALSVYDADKTGLVDYALESGGGQVMSTRCTEHYTIHTSVVSIFGIPLWYPAPSPRTVITPGVIPGECWAFQGFPGSIIIKLSHMITIEAFSYEHVNRKLVPTGKIDSAPKHFQVFGLHYEADKEPTLLGDYEFDGDGDSLQFFAAQVPYKVFQIVELKVHSNHGNLNYTCLYRFRVHGKLSK